MSGINYFDVIRSPLLTEKATDLKEKLNHICFKVDRRANKKQITEALEKIFNVKVTGIRVLNAKPKKKKLGRSSGFRTGYKKAIITLKDGDSIDIFEKVS
ncbi:MAG: 50S ribosomal protein L23 [bacterium]|nr:MAG: 50S ribosomal protein L23 [bacterium]